MIAKTIPIGTVMNRNPQIPMTSAATENPLVCGAGWLYQPLAP
jgi:hypothetical protein